MRISKQQKLAKQQQIIQVATQLFIQEGYEAVTIRQIAKTIGMATGTLFNYFASKDALAIHIVSQALLQAENHYLQNIQGAENLNQNLYCWISCGLRELKPMRSFLSPVFEHSFSAFPQANRSVDAQLAKQQQLDRVQDIIAQYDVHIPSSDMSLNIYWSLYLGILAFWLNDESHNQQDTQAMIDYSITLFVNALYGHSEQ